MTEYSGSARSYEHKPAILIGGTPRVGKTRLANKLVELTGFDLIHCDEFRNRFWSIPDELNRSSERCRQYGEALSRRHKGLVIEGDDLIGRNPGNGALARQGAITTDVRPSLSLLLHLGTQPEVRAFVVGFIEPNLGLVTAAIRRHDGGGSRLRTLSDAQLRNYVRASAQRSRLLKSMADEASVPFIELTGHDPDSAIEAAAQRILRECIQVRAAGAAHR